MSAAIARASVVAPVCVHPRARRAGRRAVAPPVRASAPGGAESVAISDRTRRLLESVEGSEGGEQAGGAGGGTTLRALERVDAAWAAIRNMPEGDAAGPAPSFVTESREPIGGTCDYDVAVCGGTLGILLAAALQARGQRVVVVERGSPQGSRSGVEHLPPRARDPRPPRRPHPGAGGPRHHQGVQPHPMRFPRLGRPAHDHPRHPQHRGQAESAPRVRPRELRGCRWNRHGARRARRRRRPPRRRSTRRQPSAERRARPELELRSAAPAPLTARLIVDCMGFGSPVVRQARHGQRPDGVCLVVGSCARGFDPDENRGADLIYTCTDIREDYQGQYFWEAFPAGSGPRDRTTYMFTYVDADPSRPSLASLLDDYWDLMPRYQGLDSIEQVDLQRVLFGYFPTYRDSPLPAAWDRVTQIGDASGMQSPLSFGGLAALLRHIGRLTDGMEDALLSDALDRECLATLNQYQPALSASWLFQKCMSVRPGARPPRDFINRLMGINFGVMESLGDDVSRPFLQDVVKFDSLGKTLLTMAATKPLFVPQILVQAGPGPILDWVGHFANLGVYTLLSVASERGPLAGAVRAVAGVAPSRELLRGEQTAESRDAASGGISPCWISDEDSCSVERWTRGSGGAGETTAERRATERESRRARFSPS